MKTLICIICSLFFYSFAYAQTIENIVNTPPSEVKVFLSGAEVSHKADLKLAAGQNTFRFIRLPISINMNSINFNLGDKVKILSISGESNTTNWEKNSKEMRFWQDSLAYINHEIAKLRFEIEGWTAELNLLKANQARIGTANSLSLTDLQNFSKYYSERFKDLEENTSRQKQKIEKWNERLSTIQEALKKVSSKEANALFDINLVVMSKEAHTVSATWSYVIREAGWSPLYDLRSEGIGKPIEFTYKGEIINNSGIDWKNVKLTLSTADVMQNTTPPYLTAWKLDFNDNELNYFANNAIQQQQVMQSRIEMEESRAGVDLDRSGSITGTFSDVAVSELSTEFEIKELYNIPADNKAYSVEVNEYQLKADYIYVCTPKMDKDAFLMTRIVGWETLNLIEGNANIYYGNSYIGKTYINLRSANDTLEVSLGRDKKLIVNRVKKQDFSSRKFLSSTVRELFTYEINVRNTNNAPITLKLKDQVPTSGNSEIEIEILDISNANRDSDTGILTWEVELAQGEAKTYTLSYAIKYPKSKKINLNKTKMQRQYKK
ncbi:MAG: DUF4139 domain-containing protein [Thermoflexibacter sp.]|jgi:uncharacterized protein (TIGR02231 family)|nr:DUF4139 domain-containing protein [Thermoflexibacter sp.]